MQDINRMIDDVINLRRNIRWFIEDRIYRFRNIEFDMIDILRCFITEYVYYLCKYYIDYISRFHHIWRAFRRIRRVPGPLKVIWA